MQFFQKLGEGVATLPTLHKLARNSKWWDEDPTRTAFEGSPHAQASDIILRSCATKDRDLSEAFVDLEAADRPLFSQFPEAMNIAHDLLRIVSGSRLGRVVITKLEPGCKIEAHRDEGPYPEYYDRYHIVMQGLPGSVFKCGDEAVQMQTGEIWWVDVKHQHEVTNNSADDRIHLIVDIHVDR